MHILYSKLKSKVKKRIREGLKNVYVTNEKNKIVVPSFEVPYNKGSEVGEIMTDREILLSIAKDVKVLKTDVKVLKTDVKVLKTDVKKNTEAIKVLTKIVKKNHPEDFKKATK